MCLRGIHEKACRIYSVVGRQLYKYFSSYVLGISDVVRVVNGRVSNLPRRTIGFSFG